MTQPIKVHIIPSGPNPWKVINILEELGLPYDIHAMSFPEVKSEPFTSINPNGRVPAIEDPNTGLTLWESGAIITYLIEQYDTTHKISYGGLKERHEMNQWLHFQVSGQGPYYGQAGWFYILHPEKIPSAIDRYRGEIKRVLGVLDGVLEGRQWLVGDKCTFADLSFLPWNARIDAVTGWSFDEVFADFPNVKAWHGRMSARPAWLSIMEKRTQLLDADGMQPSGLPKGTDSWEEWADNVRAQMAEMKRAADAAAAAKKK